MSELQGCVSYMFDQKGQIIIDKEECEMDADEIDDGLLWMPVLRTSARKRTVMRFSLLRMISVQFAKLWKKQVCLLQKHRLP